jgi:hypothetical protein
MSSGLPPLLPAPREATRRPGQLRLRDGGAVVIGPAADDSDFASARALVERVREASGVALAVETHARRDGLGPHVALAREGDAGEAYRVSVAADGARLWADGRAGLRHAVETLAQLVDARGALPACEIADAPDLALRGIMLDVSRGKVPTLEALRDLVDLCARLKLNLLMLYVEHTFRFRRHPEIGEGASPLTAQVLRELDAYAAARHVELVPSLQSLGHMDHVLNLPRYAQLAETPRNWTLAPSLPGTYELLSDLYDEFLPNFRSKLFNANCDETFDLGLGRSAAMLAELGPGGPYRAHVRRLRELARAHGKRLMIWADMAHAHPEQLGEFDRDVVFLDWWYEARFDFDRVKRLAEAGFDFLVCPGTSSWNCLFPRVENSLENIRRWAEAGRRHGALGLLVTDWGDFGHYNLLGGSLYAYAFAAEQAWGARALPADFDRAFSKLVFGTDAAEPARRYRELGACHDAGFEVFNASPLQFLFFDDLDEAYFVRGARSAALRRTRRRLERAREGVARLRAQVRREARAADELAWAADASLFAVDKASAGLAWLAWRRRPTSLDARGRRALARRLDALAREQAALGRRLRSLWLARSHISEFELTAGRLRRSAASLRRAAAALRGGRPPAPPAAHEGFDPGRVMRAVVRTLAPR